MIRLLAASLVGALALCAASHAAAAEFEVRLIDQISPSGNRIFVSVRGPLPLSGDPHSATGNTPGLAMLRVTHAGSTGLVKAIAPISNVDAGGAERADAHGIALRRK